MSIESTSITPLSHAKDASTSQKVIAKWTDVTDYLSMDTEINQSLNRALTPHKLCVLEVK